MTDLLRHRGPAVLLSAIEELDSRSIRCRADRARPWHWPELLEAAAQASGILAAQRSEGLRKTAVVVQFWDVSLTTTPIAGPLWFRATLQPGLMSFQRCRFEVLRGDGEVVLMGGVMLAAQGERVSEVPADGAVREGAKAGAP